MHCKLNPRQYTRTHTILYSCYFSAFILIEQEKARVVASKFCGVSLVRFRIVGLVLLSSLCLLTLRVNKRQPEFRSRTSLLFFSPVPVLSFLFSALVHPSFSNLFILLVCNHFKK